MTQDELWQSKYNEVIAFMEKNKRNPSKYDAEERGAYVNWLRHNKKMMKVRLMKPDREVLFKRLLELNEQNKRKKQYE